MADYKKLIQWLGECYREDRTRMGVRDFFSSAVSNRSIVRGQEKLALGAIDEDVLPPKAGVGLLKRSLLYRREKEVLYGCLFVCGIVGLKKLRAPLVFYPVILVEAGDGVVVQLDRERWRLNRVVLELADDAKSLEAELSVVLQGGELSEVNVSEIGRVLESYLTDLDTSELYLWPNVKRSGAIEATCSSESSLRGELKLLPGAGYGIVDRSVGSRGVIDELTRLGNVDEEQWSAALRGLLMGELSHKLNTKERDKPLLAPALLSMQQEHVIRSSRVSPLTVCHGPPGTGKSFTIACMAVDHIARGESVLVVSQKDHAVDVVQAKIYELVGGMDVCIRGGRKGYLKLIKKRIDRILNKYLLYDDESDLRKLEKATDAVLDSIYAIERQEGKLLKELEKSIHRGAAEASKDDGWYHQMKKVWHRYRIKCRPLLLEMDAHIESLHKIKERQIRDVMLLQRNMKQASAQRKQRGDLKALLDGLKKYRSSDQQKSFMGMNFDAVIDTFPVWLTSGEDIHRVIPFGKELFDVVIVDESSQCDIASVLPAIQRAKRVVIVGDEKQLRHISFLSKSNMHKYADELGIDRESREKFHYRDVSLMDLANAQVTDFSQVGLLNEHFRSLPEIISFSNKRFYSSQLRMMRDHSTVNGEALEMVRCSGKRLESGVNEVEADKIIDDVHRLIREEESCVSIGILSPFRAQVDYLTDRLMQVCGTASIDRHDVRVGTAHSFQGEERDVMFLSMAISADDAGATLRFLEQEDIFNVSITRAKNKQFVYHSVDPISLPAESLLRAYLTSVSHEDHSIRDDRGFSEYEHFVEEVSEEFERHGYSVDKVVSLAEIQVDILLEHNGKKLGLDLVGYPGLTQMAVSMRENQMLSRVGVDLVPIGYAEWQIYRSEIVSAVVEMMRCTAIS